MPRAEAGRKRAQAECAGAAYPPARVKRRREEPGQPTSETLYIKNLNDQVSSSDLRAALYMLCSAFGRVVAINAHKSPKMRGQAHVAFATAQSASTALAALQGRPFLGKPLAIAYARTKAHRLEWAQRDGLN